MNKHITKLIVAGFILSFLYFFTSCNDSGVLEPITENTLYVKNFGGVNSDVLTSMEITSDGGSIMTGYTISSSFGDNDVYAIKLDQRGSMVWSNIYGSSSNDQASTVIQTSDGGYLLSGQTRSFNAQNFDIYITKLGSSGNIEWSSIYQAANDDFVAGGIEAEGGYIIAGHSNSFASASNSDIFLMKISTNGNIEWIKSYGGIENDFASAIRKTANGYVVAGYTFSFTSTNDLFVLNYSPNGTIIWSRIFSGFGDDKVSSIEPSGNDFILAGYTQSFGLSSEDMFILKLDVNGFAYNNIDGSPRTFGDSALLPDRAFSVVPTPDGGFLVTGFVTTSTDNQDLAVIKLFGNCEFAWAKKYPANNNDAGTIIRKRNNNYLVAGNSYSTGSNDIYFLSLRDDGGSCSNSVGFTPLGGNPQVIEGPVTVIINDVTSTFQKMDVQSSNSNAGFSQITGCESR